MSKPQRTASLDRATSESKVSVRLDLDGTGASTISTGVGFYDHMLTALARHSLIDLEVRAEGDWSVDAHHTVEDTAIVLGQALREALGDKIGIRRFGDALVPLDEALAQAVVDVSGRPYCVHSGEPDGQAYVRIGGGTDGSVPYTGSLTRHVFETLAFHAHLCLHVTVLAGRDPHHIVECQFKAVARALRDAIALDPRVSRGAQHQGHFVRVVVLDYGSGNLRSAERALARAGAEVTVTADRSAALAADGLVVPGVGAFAACMDGLAEVGGPAMIARAAGRRAPDPGHLRRPPGAVRRGDRARRTRPWLCGLARRGRAAAGRAAAAHGLEHRGAGRGQPAVRGRGVGAVLLRAQLRRSVVRAGARASSPPGPTTTATGSSPPWRTGRCGRPSSIRRSPATPGPG